MARFVWGAIIVIFLIINLFANRRGMKLIIRYDYRVLCIWHYNQGGNRNSNKNNDKGTNPDGLACSASSGGSQCFEQMCVCINYYHEAHPAPLNSPPLLLVKIVCWPAPNTLTPSTSHTYTRSEIYAHYYCPSGLLNRNKTAGPPGLSKIVNRFIHMLLFSWGGGYYCYQPTEERPAGRPTDEITDIKLNSQLNLSEIITLILPACKSAAARVPCSR